MFSCPELTSREAMVDGRLKKKYTKFATILKKKKRQRIQEIFLPFFFAFSMLIQYHVLCVPKTAVQAIDATPQEKSNSKITPLLQ